ncbi:hypothetical protein PV08_03081 [Exophiala spinifera]|uniref:Uncharacterized protein n=1 Tax=Exophiala spinifera TaxID=91928 RepID=A0A0D2A1E8_9EURO|nr:uncharacterized protein PV08_03081 [Exophiala spinifera]KIW18792.1 hypothetical protein PV08_03081 [Exophiala spinifera]
MSFRGVMKDGWHPKGKDGGKESWRGDFKGINQMAGWMGKGQDRNKKNEPEHISRPLSSLKDPAAFGPPPKNVNYHGGAALPNEITPQRSGWGAPLTQEQIASANRTANGPTEEEIEEEKRRAGPPLPYRADRTGLRTDHLPPPPVHRDVNRNADEVEPPQRAQPPKPAPGLPPRLPSRQNTSSTPTLPPTMAASPAPQAPPPAYEAATTDYSASQPSSNYGINQAAMSRLGNAGVSVPSLGIGSNASSNPWQNEQSQAAPVKSPSPKPPTQPQSSMNQLSELQSRFARMNSSSSAHSPTVSATPAASYTAPSQSPPPSQPAGTTWAEQQAAFRTAQNLHSNPSTVTAQDAAAAARTANSFRERHQDTISAAGAKANEWNKKYNVAGRLNSFLEKHSSPSSETPPPVNAPSPAPAAVPAPATSPELAASISRKPPPPPPPKKPANMHGSLNSMSGGPGAGVTSSPPPPVPLGTKPSYT